MEPQIYNQVAEDSWLTDPWGSEFLSMDNVSDVCPEYLWNDKCDPLTGNLENFQYFNNPEPFSLPSPISECSFSEQINTQSHKLPLNSWLLSTNFDNGFTSSDQDAISASGDVSPTLSSSSAPSPESIQSTPTQDTIDYDTSTKQSKKRSRNGQPKNSRAKSSIYKQNKSQSSHNLIEKRYRAKLNGKIYALCERVPSLRTMSEDAEDSKKSSKTAVLDETLNYITELEKQLEKISKENQRLQLVVDASLNDFFYAGKTVGRRRQGMDSNVICG